MDVLSRIETIKAEMVALKGRLEAGGSTTPNGNREVKIVVLK